jgi:hypothetical protein
VIDHFILPEQGQYLVMDFVDGETLDTLLQREESLPLEKAIVWIEQVCDALDYLHTHEPPVLHRDIKPANIRITPKGQAMLVDFGLVKISDPHLKTTIGARAITPGYSPPEQYGLGTTDARSDLYALGATLYRLVTGRDPLESVQRIAGEALLPVREINPRVSPALAQVIERSLSMDSDQRYQSAGELRTALRSGLATPAVPPPPAPTPVRDYRTRDVELPPASQARPAPIVRTVVAPAGSEYPVTPYAGVPPAAVGPTARQGGQASGSRNKWLIGAGVAILLVICLLGAMILGGGLALGRRSLAQSTATAQAQATAISQLQMTSTALQMAGVKAANTDTPVAAVVASATRPPSTTQPASPTRPAATVTRSVNTGATASAQATERARNNELATLTAYRELLYGPRSGRLVHDSDDFLESTPSTPGIRNFDAEIKFMNPYPLSTGSWGYGMIFRSEGGNRQFRVHLDSKKNWDLTLNTGSGDGQTLKEGTFAGINTSENGSNLIRVIAKEDRGWLYINDALVAELDLSGRYAGSVYGFIYDEIAGEITPYEDFTVWKLAK